MNQKVNPPGIKVRVSKDSALQLIDGSGKWIATVIWRPRGELRVQLDEAIQKKIERMDHLG
jgi:hypothetical protein